MSVNHSALIEEAVKTLQAGDLVAFPTETVYGLGADAKNPEAIKKIFSAKGRPSNHPLIVHIAAPEKSSESNTDWTDVLSPWVRDLSEDALKLIHTFWPGPLTLVFKKDNSVLFELTGGQNTVAIRSPAHPIAQELLHHFQGGVVAPSANRFGKVSPTRAADVRSEFQEIPHLKILDGGDCDVGIESTIIDFSSGDQPVLLRPGFITPTDIFLKTGVRVSVPGQCAEVERASNLPRVSGSLRAHYAPSTALRLYSPDRIVDTLSEYPDIKSHVTAVVWDSDSALSEQIPSSIELQEIPVPMDSKTFAATLYRLLRDLDKQNWDLILFPEPPIGEEWDGIRDRLQRACVGSGPSSKTHSNN
jgi:L-threonylcarbamoyladenylate synthase